MPTIRDTLSRILEAQARIQAIQVERARYESSAAAERPDDFIDRSRRYSSDIRQAQIEMQEALREFELWPECHHARLMRQLERFHEIHPFSRCVFVMTKYPDGIDGVDNQLKRVIETVTNAIVAAGYQPRVADGKAFHPWIWGNVEVYLLGCHKGIAIVEDKYRPELNPNVAMEWGFMKAMQRDVLFLRERSFDHERADWRGLISSSFDWHDPAKDIPGAIENFLKG